MQRLDPKARIPLELAGVTLYLGPLTKLAKDELVSVIGSVAMRRGLDLADPDVVFDPLYVHIAMREMLYSTLVGWDGIDAKFSKKQDKNVAKAWEKVTAEDLSDEDKVRLLETLQGACGLRDGEEKNSLASSGSPSSAGRSTVADGGIA